MGVQKIEAGVIEGHWLISNTETKYRLRLPEASPPTDVVVDCTAMAEGDYCYGYFTDVSENPCTNIVAKQITDGTYTDDAQMAKPTYSEVDQVQSGKTDTTTLAQALHVTAHGIDWHQNLVDVNVTTCFNHKTTDEQRFFSHYEMLVINNEGQWVKHRQMSSTAEGDLCFEPLTLNTQDFDASAGAMVIVIQRATDGVTVLASGKTTLF